jgi:hypothetical protein
MMRLNLEVNDDAPAAAPGTVPGTTPPGRGPPQLSALLCSGQVLIIQSSNSLWLSPPDKGQTDELSSVGHPIFDSQYIVFQLYN